MDTLVDAERLLNARDPSGCLGVLEPMRARLGADEALTRLWLRALAELPRRETLVSEVEAALAVGSVDIAIAAAVALNGVAALRPLDAPPPSADTPAGATASMALSLCDAALGQLEPKDAGVGFLHWQRANALRALGPERDEEAVDAYLAATRAQPEHGPIWFDLCVLHKWRGRWQNALDCALKARARLGDQRGVLWNAAIAATVLGQGDVAGGFWRDLGLPVRLGRGGMPVVDGAPNLQVRVPSRRSTYGLEDEPELGFEVLWVAPTSPCHGVVVSAAFREHVIDHGDVVVWDGVPVATDPPVFPLLEQLHSSAQIRLAFVAIASPAQIAELADGLSAPDATLFATTPGADAPASSGAPNGASNDASTDEQLVRGKLIAPEGTDLRALHAALMAVLGRVPMKFAIPELYESLQDTKRAGQEHQAWRGVVRVAEKRGLLRKASGG